MMIKPPQEIPFAKFDPGGNPTVLVDNRRGEIPLQSYALLATQLMAEPFLGSEQVGFIELPQRPEMDGRLTMMGGELCINALRCIGAFLWLEGKTRPLKVETSGTDEVVSLTVEADRESVVTSLIIPFRPECHVIGPRLTMVSMPGMVHFVEEVNEHPEEREMSRALARAMASPTFRSEPFPDAVGYIAVVSEEEGFSIRPLVHVMKTGTTVMETSCGSGSLAVYAVGKYPHGQEVSMLQPSGSRLDVGSRPDGRLSITGPVRRSVSGVVHGLGFLDESSGPVMRQPALVH
jgi:diaminopimelate epimerase